MNTTDISIVIPVFNSDQGLKELFLGINNSLQGKRFEVIFIDDGSKDSSWETIEQLKKEHPGQITAIKLSRNFGQHNALLCGFNYCKGNVIITMDDDLQHPPAEIPKLLEKYNETNADVVYGTYGTKYHGVVRNAGSYFVRKTSRHAANTIGEGSSFRLIKKDIILKIRENHQQSFLFIDEIMQWYTSNVVTVSVNHAPRKHGSSNYSLMKLVNMYFDILINYTAVPLKLMTYSGLLFSLVTFCIGVRFIFRKIAYNVPLGYTSTIVSILFTASIILLCLGIIGQYIYKLYQFQHHKPPFSIQKII
ncbi:MAG: glycosyltransferase family 2 protein [Bacteroidota bacterium]|nr:glycosyltransferase family 2 protein [Bacteroidota bacterium]